MSLSPFRRTYPFRTPRTRIRLGLSTTRSGE